MRHLSSLFFLFLLGCKTIRTEPCHNINNIAISLDNYRTNRYGNAVTWEKSDFPIPIIINSNFDKFEFQTIVEAIDYWNNVTGKVIFIYITGTDEKDRIPGTIVINEEMLEKNCGIQTLGVASSKFEYNKYSEPLKIRSVVISIHKNHEKENLTYLRTVVHELGHALGLSHDEDKNSVMYPSILNDIWYIEERDIDFIKQLLF